MATPVWFDGLQAWLTVVLQILVDDSLRHLESITTLTKLYIEGYSLLVVS
jgi:hypothetical protein